MSNLHHFHSDLPERKGSVKELKMIQASGRSMKSM